MKTRLTKSEMEIMEVLWDEGKALTTSEIIQRSKEKEKEWKDSSVHLLIKSLMNKDVIRALFYLEEKYGMDIKKTDREIRLTFDIDNTDIWKLIEYLEEWATKKEEYIKKKGNTTGEFQWKIYEKYNGIKKLKAGFVNEMEAREYASFLENCNRMAGYNGSRFSIEYGCPVSEAQEGYDIWKAQFPKNLERTEIRHN